MTTGKLAQSRVCRATECWLPGVRRRGAELSATPRHVVDRPRLSWELAPRVPTIVSLSTGRLNAVPAGSRACEAIRRFFKEQRTTEYPANGSSLSHMPREEKYGQAARLISTSQLNASPRFHIWPINLVVYQEPLGALWLGRSHLVEGFTLRCLQRFSLPDVATRRCRWRDNRYTRGPSNPVLSY